MAANPWYSSTRYFAAGLTLDYNHNPLVLRGNGDPVPIVGNQLVGHVDIAGSFLDRFQLSLSLPITLAESGNDQAAFSPDLKPSGAAVGDPRIGVMIRLYGQPRTDAFTAHLGAFLWIPVQNADQHAGDNGVRFMPKLALGGISKYVRWAATLAFLVRGESVIGPSQTTGGNIIGHELQFTAGIGYVNASRRLTIGPELSYATLVTSSHAFDANYSSLELLFGGNYLINDVFMVGLGAGGGIQQEAGTPDARVLLRLAYAPQPPPDTDLDGITDDKDACPTEPGVPSDDPKKNGCPIHDRDKDGVLDEDDMCPDEPKGANPDPKRVGCPARDTDSDTVFDYEDVCPEIPMGAHPDPNPARKGCPLADRDMDGVLDQEDLCPDQPMGNHPDPTRKGCPAIDRDGDGVYDYEDVCPDVPAGLHPDPNPARKGCPESDRDKDSVPDSVDACPDQPGAPSPDPKKNGCPSLAVVKNGMIVILQPVFFATDKDVILPKSFPLLSVVRDVFVAQPEIKKVEIQGHTDIRGKYAHNMDLSDRRAKSVMRWLAANGVSADRMVAKGYGPNKPVASNRTNQGRSLNRRVEFHIIDPAPGGSTSGDAGGGNTGGTTAVPVQAAPTGAAPSAGSGTVVAPADTPALDAEGAGAKPGKFAKGKKGARAAKIARLLGKGKKGKGGKKKGR